MPGGGAWGRSFCRRHGVGIGFLSTHVWLMTSNNFPAVPPEVWSGVWIDVPTSVVIERLFIPQPGVLQSEGLRRVRRDLATERQHTWFYDTEKRRVPTCTCLHVCECVCVCVCVCLHECPMTALYPCLSFWPHCSLCIVWNLTLWSVCTYRNPCVLNTFFFPPKQLYHLFQ